MGPDGSVPSTFRQGLGEVVDEPLRKSRTPKILLAVAAVAAAGIGGVYVKLKGSLAEVYAEIVDWKSGGVSKSLLTGGFTKGHINAVVKGPKSKLQIGEPMEFVIKCMEGVTPSEYMLLKLDEKGDRREFRAVTGGVYHSSGGADKNAIKFDFQKIAPRTFKVVLTDMKKGEYGFLPPGSGAVGAMGGGASGATVQGGSMQSGKLYTFGVTE